MNPAIITYKTKSLQQAAALWSQDFGVSYVRLEPVPDQINKFLFVFEISATPEVFNQFKLDYANQRTTVEPKLYDSRLNSLRDNLSIAKHG